ncbi:TetR/AcrR family transcriptional regulator [Goodfellowiella coeruleoviolacea]|uniref:Transcriptional regulator, TetR family n=1 Tax=Goodfellowiella coeruleoviolacea TaxID=334858 RepID=A0AAE3KFS1_9PSEU|nr:TetR/AcrR family transcriptional regulator [Goodfellowiella coeruleoviolacea]MCP2165260.1 transcriptional regulator, TetR family [Goodfellowiella coeruleoviolacea]
MGTREELLNGAKRCLAERGYARTTVRDIVAVTGANLAAINYHFGTKDALLNQALLESASEAVGEILNAVRTDPDPAARLRTFLTALTESFVDKRAMWATNIEALAQAAHSPDLRTQLAAGQVAARTGLADMSPTTDRDDESTRAAVGAVHMTLLSGLLVQWMVAPDQAPTADLVIEGLRTLGTTLAKPAAD